MYQSSFQNLQMERDNLEKFNSVTIQYVHANKIISYQMKKKILKVN